MSSVDDRLNRIVQKEQDLQARERELMERSGGGGGGGKDPGDQRISRLETQFDKLAEKLDKQVDAISTVKTELAAIKTKLDFMPTRFEFYTGLVALLGALVTLNRTGLI